MRNQRGFTLVELLIVVAIVGILSSIAIPLFQDALMKARVAGLGADSRTVYMAFKRHHIDTGMYPNASNDPSFQLDTFEPLVSMDYYDGSIVTKLQGKQADAYDSPDDRGDNQEFWLEITLAANPMIRYLIVDSDDAPLADGEYLDGTYLYVDGELREIHDPT